MLLKVILSACCAYWLASTALLAKSKEEYQFDTSLLRGSAMDSESLHNFNPQEVLAPGNYELDLFLNDLFLQRTAIHFIRNSKQQVVPCLDAKQIELLALIKTATIAQGQSCLQPGEKMLEAVVAQIDMSQLRLTLTIPQALLQHKARGEVSAERLTAGESMVLINYNVNQYHVSYHQNSYKQNMDSTYANLDGGVNLGLWHYRQISNYTYDRMLGGRWSTNRRYVQRAFLPLRSNILLGDGATAGSLFSGLGFRGVQLSSDERMLPNSLRGYAPEVRGIARSNARVAVFQGKEQIYQTTVPPGPFVINDLYAINYATDLTVVVTEADGRVATFNVPFAAVPESIRPGFSRYETTLGASRDTDSQRYFSEATWQYGLTNPITLNMGNRLASGYQAWVLGGVYGSRLGAIGANITWSRAHLPEDLLSGWMLNLTYSKTFTPTNTTLSLASYRYSNQDYLELGDFFGLHDSFTVRDSLAMRNSSHYHQRWSSASYHQRSRQTVAINQSLETWGYLLLSGSRQDYRDRSGSDTQLQLGWGKTFSNGLSLNLSVTRVHTLQNEYDQQKYYQQITDRSYNETGINLLSNSRKENIVSFSLSIPLGQSAQAPNLSLFANHSREEENNREHSNSLKPTTSYQTTLAGNLGEEQPISYGLNYSADSTGQQNIWGTDLQTHLPYGALSGSYSHAQNYWQGSAAMQGAAVLHRGGITLGPYVGDTFALIEAQGAEGAHVQDGNGTRINHFGYALSPALTPYSNNIISLNPDGMSSETELLSAQQQIAPYAGATVRVKFATLTGQALLVTAQLKNSESIPIGADVKNSSNKSIAAVGQANQIYLRSNESHLNLTVQWGEGPDEQCQIDYPLPPAEKTLLRIITVPCTAPHPAG